MALSGSNQRLGLANDATEVCDARIAEVAVMDLGANRYPARACNFRIADLTL